MSNFILLHRANDGKPCIVNVDNISSIVPNEEEENTTYIYNSSEELIETVTEDITEIYKKLERSM